MIAALDLALGLNELTKYDMSILYNCVFEIHRSRSLYLTNKLSIPKPIKVVKS